MKQLLNLTCFFLKRRLKDGFTIGYNLIFPVIMVLLLGYLTNRNFGDIVSSYQYYAIVTIPFCILMSITTAAYAAKDCAYQKTAMRFVIAPVSTTQILMANVLSCTIAFFLCYFVLFFGVVWIYRLAFSMTWLYIPLLYLSMSFLVSAIGTWIGNGMKDFLIIKNIMNIPVGLLAFLGGCFYPIGSMNHIFRFIIHLSPLTWINQAMFRCVFSESETNAVLTSMLLFLVGFVCCLIGRRSFRKEEFLYGELPGYEK
ncbi:MAG: ABC transporter permease [Clostridia bacterium]|nr:ABC transporter permease [Clostridia bacterium]